MKLYLSALTALLCATGVTWAQNSSSAPRNGNPGGVRYLELGQPPVVIHPTVEAVKKAHRSSTSGGNLYYHAGTSDGLSGNIGVETAPRIYLVFWGSQWDNNDPSGEAAILKSFLPGASGSSWLNTVTQYCQGVSSGTYFCNGAGTPAGNSTGEYITFWYDNASKAPSHPRQSQIASEAVRAASHFGNTSTADNTSAQYVIATATGNSSSGFGSQYCAYHSSTSSSTAGDVAYTNLPYITDAGASCGANFNGLGPDAGITIVEGHEAAETITDQFPSGGWLDSGGSEIGDKCAWISTGSQGASADVSFSTGTYPVQSLWSNAFNSDSGGCVLSY